MRYRNNGQIEEELQIRFTGYLIQAVKRTRRDYLNMLNQYSNSEILTDTTYTPGQTLEQEVTERLPLPRFPFYQIAQKRISAKCLLQFYCSSPAAALS